MEFELSDIKDIILSISAGIGAAVAIIGLGTWRKQLTGKVEYNAARQLLISIYKIRDAMMLVRNPFISSGEMMDINNKDEKEKNQINEGVEIAYSNRWQKVSDAHTEASTNLLEAEALWGDDIKNRYVDLTKNITKLYSTIRLYITSLESYSDLKFRDRDQDILYFNSEKSKDLFQIEVDKKIESIEKILKPHLNRRD
jgi:hypothetical protein